jgi:hypothetical protein
MATSTAISATIAATLLTVVWTGTVSVGGESTSAPSTEAREQSHNGGHYGENEGDQDHQGTSFR